MTDATNNPLGTDGFEFVEFAAPDPDALAGLFEKMGFVKVGRHRRKAVDHYRQGDINFILNREPDSQAARFVEAHGPCANAMAFRVRDAAFAIEEAVRRGAKPVAERAGPMELNIPAVEGVGGLMIYLVDRYGANSIYDVDFEPVEGAEAAPAGMGLTYIDHLTHNVYKGGMAKWAKFYEDVFNFREIRFFDIEGKKTGLFSKAMTSPDGKIRIPLNESQDDKSQIVEYLEAYRGEGIQHIALGSDDIYRSVPAMRERGIVFQDTPDAYFDLIDTRLPGHGENVEALRKDRILIDGGEAQGGGLLLQIYTENVIGPIFFEIIQRKGNDGFGEGNFQALFESIELEQERRGVI